MADLNYDVSVNTSQAERNLDRLEKSIGGIGSAFGALQRAIAGLAIGSFITNSLNLAARLDTLGQVTGIATANLRGFQQAVSQAGGNSDKAVDAVSDLVKNIGEAANGSGELVSSFAQVGVSINDLRTLSEQDILKKTIDGLARIPDQAKRSALSMKLMGEAVKTVDFRSVSASYGTFTAQSAEFARSAAAAREAQDKMALAMDKLRDAVVVSIKPILDFIAALDVNKIALFIKAVIDISTALAGLFILSKVAGGVLLLAQAFNRAKLATGGFLSTILGGTGILKSLGDTFVLFRTAVTAAGGATLTLGGRFALLLSGVLRLVPIFGTVIVAFQALNAALEIITGSGFVDWAQRAAKAIGLISETSKEAAAKVKQQNDAEIQRLKDLSDKQKKQQEEFRRGQEAAAKFAAEIAKQAASYKLANAEHSRFSDQLRTSMGFQTGLIGLTEEQIELETNLRQEAERYLAVVQSLTDKQQTLRNSMIGETDAEKVKLYNAEIGQINKSLKIASDQHLKNRDIIDRQTAAIQSARLVEQARLQDIENTTNAINAQLDRQQALGDILRGANQQRSAATDALPAGQLTGLSSIQRQIVEIQEAAHKAAQEAGRAFAANFEDSGDGLTPESARELAAGLDQIARAYGGVAQAQIAVVKNNYESARSFSAGWTDAFASFKEDAMNAGKQASDSFNNFTSGMEDAFVSFVQTGKLSFKSLANSIIADLVRIAVRRAIVAAIGGPLGMLFGGGRANGGSVAGGTSYVVGERGPELFVPQTAGKIISNAALTGSGQNNSSMGGGQTVVNYNIQAVDASSFRSLVARDPSFIYAVTEQGRRSQPTRSR